MAYVNIESHKESPGKHMASPGFLQKLCSPAAYLTQEATA
jgi:hypothetical protein